MSFGGDTKSRRSLLSGVYARGSKRSHQSALEMCNLSWTPQYNSLNHSCVSPKMGCLEYIPGGLKFGSHGRPRYTRIRVITRRVIRRADCSLLIFYVNITILELRKSENWVFSNCVRIRHTCQMFRRECRNRRIHESMSIFRRTNFLWKDILHVFHYDMG